METSVDFDRPTFRDQSDAEKYRLREKLFGSEGVYPMWVADMEFQAAPAIQQALAARVKHGVYGYALPDDEMFALAAAWQQKRHGLEVPAEAFGASPSIMTTMSAAIEAFSEVGEGVTTLVPVYPPFLEVVRTQKRLLHAVELSDTEAGYRIDFDTLKTALEKSKILLLCNPHNPVGRVWTRAELRQIADLCQAYDITIISDDAHADIVMPDFCYQSITTVSEYAKLHTLTLTGPGKGFNISGLATTLFFSFNTDIDRALKAVFKARHVVAGQIMGYTALKAAYQASEPWLDQLLPYLQKNINEATDQINRSGYLKANTVEGTYLLWIDCRGLGLSDQGVKKFFEEKVGIGLSLGRTFGNGGKGFMRMNLAVPYPQLCTVLHNVKKVLINHKA